MLSRNVETNDGTRLRVLVQPDFRYIIYYIIQRIQSRYSIIRIEDAAYVTPASLAAFILMQVVAYIAMIDLSNRANCSQYAIELGNDQYTKGVLELLKTTPLHPFAEDVINALRRHFLQFRSRVEFTPSLGGAIFEHDAGRLISPIVLLAAHNCLLTRLRDVAHPEHTFMMAPIVQYNNVLYRVGNVLGYVNAADLIAGNNWLFDIISGFADPNVQRTHTRRHVMREFDLRNVMNFTQENFNPYRYMLMSFRNFESSLKELIKECSFLTRKEFLASILFIL